MPKRMGVLCFGLLFLCLCGVFGFLIFFSFQLQREELTVVTGSRYTSIWSLIGPRWGGRQGGKNPCRELRT